MQQQLEQALQVKHLYQELNALNHQQSWTYLQYMEGLVGDSGDLMKMLMAKANLRSYKGNLDKDIAHELSDCLWSILMISQELGMNIEEEFSKNMAELKTSVQEKIDSSKI